MANGNQKRVGEDYPKKNFQTDYKTGRFLARVISFFGWLLIVLAIVIPAIALAVGQRSEAALPQMGGPSVYVALAAICSGLVLTGIILVAVGHVMPATMDTANATRQMLEIMKD